MSNAARASMIAPTTAIQKPYARSGRRPPMLSSTAGTQSTTPSTRHAGEDAEHDAPVERDRPRAHRVRERDQRERPEAGEEREQALRVAEGLVRLGRQAAVAAHRVPGQQAADDQDDRADEGQSPPAAKGPSMHHPAAA